MTPQVFKARVQGFSTVMIALTSAYLVYYLYRSVGRAYRFSLGEPDMWINHWRVEDSAVIAQSTRVTYFCIWMFVILASTVAVIAALHLLNRCRKGLIFDAVTARAVQHVGGLLIIAMIADQLFGAVDWYLLTKHNLVNQESIQWAYDPTDYKTIALALVLFMFGWVMREAIEVEQTNKEFV